MIPRLLIKALSALAAHPEVRRRVIAAARDPEVRRQIITAANKGVESFRRWWADRESRKNPARVEPPISGEHPKMPAKAKIRAARPARKRTSK